MNNIRNVLNFKLIILTGVIFFGEKALIVDRFYAKIIDVPYNNKYTAGILLGETVRGLTILCDLGNSVT